MTHKKDSLSLYEPAREGAPVTIVDIPLELGSDERGFAETPGYIRKNGLEKMLTALGREIAEHASVLCEIPERVASVGTMKNVEEIVKAAHKSRAIVEKAGKRGDFVIALGGDHAISLGTIAGASAAHNDLGLIYIDAHPDCTTETSTDSGNVHGMIVSSAIGEGNALLTDLFPRKVRPENVLYIAIKDIDQGEIDLIREKGIQYFTMLDIATSGLAPLAKAIGELGARTSKVWVSLDLDSIDERFAPGVAMTTPDGLTRREITAIAQTIGKTCDVAGADIAEMIPAKDREGITAGLVIEVLSRFLGGEYTWYKQYMDHYREIQVTVEEREVVRIRERVQE